MLKVVPSPQQFYPSGRPARYLFCLLTSSVPVLVGSCSKWKVYALDHGDQCFFVVVLAANFEEKNILPFRSFPAKLFGMIRWLVMELLTLPFSLQPTNAIQLSHCIGGTVLVAPIVLVQTQGKKWQSVGILVRFGAAVLAATVLYCIVCTTWLVNLQK